MCVIYLITEMISTNEKIVSAIIKIIMNKKTNKRKFIIYIDSFIPEDIITEIFELNVNIFYNIPDSPEKLQISNLSSVKIKKYMKD